MVFGLGMILLKRTGFDHEVRELLLFEGSMNVATLLQYHLEPTLQSSNRSFQGKCHEIAQQAARTDIHAGNLKL